MSLSAKIKDILHSDESKDTSETSHHPPGSFPTEDMEPSETHQGYSKGYEQNKLHKADDPRGHAHKDSGVGFTESNDPASYKPSQEPISERRDDPLDRTTEPTTAAGGLGDTSKVPATEGATGAAAPSTQDPPYWGDLPSEGVHNTVIGHGSPEDENARHRAVHFGATEPTRTAGTLESGTFLHRTDRDTSSTTNPHDAQRYGQENPRQTSGSHFSEGVAGAGAAGAGALGAHELNKRRHADDTSTPSKVDQTTDKAHDEHKGRSFPLLGKDHKDKETHHKETHHKEDKHAKEPKEHESKLGALFHRKGSKDKTETEAKAEQEADRERHGHSKTGPAAPALAAAGAAWGANAAGRGHDDKTQRDATATQDLSGTRGATQYPASGLDSARDYSSQPTTGTTRQPYQQDSSHPGAGLATGAVAGVGAGALASHYAQRSDNDRTGAHTGTGYDSQSYDPSSTSTRDPTSQTYQQQGSHGDHSLAKGTTAGLGAGALASHSGQHSSSNQPTTLGSSSAYGTQPDQPANFSLKDPAGQTYQQQDSHRGAGLAAGTAAGLDAGALASRSGREHETSGQHTGLDSSRGLESQGTQSAYSSTNPTSQYQQNSSHRGAGLAAGTAAGLGAGALASRSGHDHETTGQHSGLDSNRGFESQGAQSGYSSTRDPTSQQQQQQQQDSHRGAGLAAGTAAGLGAGALASRSGRDHHSDQPTGLESNRGFDSQSNQPTQASTRDTTSQSYQQEGSHRGAGLATGAAAGLGAGALASHESNKRDEDRYLSNDNSRAAHPGTTGTGAGFGTSSSAFDSSRHEPSRKSEHSQRSTGSHHSTLTENANAGKYNTLASGTPSGVAYDDDLDTSRSTQKPYVDASQKKDDHFGAKAAGLGAAATGAGTAAALSRNKDEKPVEEKTRKEPETERKLDRDTESHRPITGAVAPQLGTNKPVIHKCQKCGEDNDISQYFTSNSGKI
ncbi:uncharacterized protein BKA55DRAFT_696510 [Fusarium redolens]|uniref:Uncharacterized protein n=1 Tax=Fusarium redolens TaxID=48865 RepID=A0A9P9FZK8_FUSRE|nr:uncharacterized protein BKA55DRAFT_696510 [Fusarium redolens]KAH7230575.1 hypothetical protein BKA55DRAFT_696510 [Fusarium redolens]